MADRPLRVAIVHDWLVGGGAELVVEQLHKMFPNAPIYTSYCTSGWRKRLDNKVVTGWLQYLGIIRKFIPFLRIWWFTHLDLEQFDLVISSSGAEAKGIRLGEQRRSWAAKLTAALGAGEHRKGAVHKSTVTAERSTQQHDVARSHGRVNGSAGEQDMAVRRPLHINYCHAPTHYYWSRYGEYMEHPGFGKLDWLARIGLQLLVGPLRRWDYKAAQRPDVIIANSTHTAQKIKKYYDRSATVIHPPVYFERFTKPQHRTHVRRGFVVSGRQTPYKRFDIAVAACTKLDLPLTVIGAGPDHRRLRKLAGKSVTFLGKVSDAVLEEEFARAEALIFPGVDDFGITAVEALAAGTPVIAYKGGGSLDYIKPGVTGEFFTRQTVHSLAQILSRFRAHNYNPKNCRDNARQFSAEAFRGHMSDFIAQVIKTELK